MEKEQKQRKCATCGDSFKPTGQRQVYCAACGKEHRKAKQHEYNQTHDLRYHGGKKL